MKKAMQLLGKLGKRADDPALILTISNESILHYIQDFIEEQALEIPDHMLKQFFERVVQELKLNIMENYGTELRVIVHFVAERQGIVNTDYYVSARKT